MADVQTKLSSFLSTVASEEIPDRTRNKSVGHLLDTMGAIISGGDSKVVSASLRTMRVTYGGSGNTPILIPQEAKLPSLPAAFIHGVSAHACEVDDSGGCDHSGATTLPALISALEHAAEPVGGSDFLSAYTIGYEASRRVQSALGGYDAVNSRGWHSTGVCGVFGAAAASARILALPPNKFSMAIGIAGSYCGGTWAFMDNNAWTKKIHVGRACELGLNSVLLANHGITGPSELFNSTWGGLLSTYMENGNTDYQELTRGLGTRWMIDRASIKPYATCRSTHSTVVALDLVISQTGILTEDIKSVKIFSSELLLRMCGAGEWRTVEAAQMSVVAAATAFLRWGAVGPTELAALVAGDSQADKIRNRIHLLHDPKIKGTEEPIIIVELIGGKNYRVEHPMPTGGPANPFSFEQICSKFREITSKQLRPQAQEDIISEFSNIEDISDMLDVFRKIKLQLDSVR